MCVTFGNIYVDIEHIPHTLRLNVFIVNMVCYVQTDHLHLATQSNAYNLG